MKAGANSDAGVDFIKKLVTEHVKLRPGSGREATDVFVQGSGDVLISYENEAIGIERAGKPVEHVNLPQTFRIDNPVAVVNTSPHLDAAVAFKNFQYTAAAPEGMGASRFPAGRSGGRRRLPNQYPVPTKLWTIADLGGWATADPQLFDKNTGSITKIYTKATG